MSDFQEQLALLRRRMARIDRKYQSPPLDTRPAPAPVERGPSRYYIEEWSSGEVVQTECGTHFETTRHWERHRRHGSMDLSDLADLPPDLLGAISEGQAPACPVERWAFLDTETTGLAGGTGTCAFLVGVGRIAHDGFHLRQFFMRDYGEEASLLCALAAHLGEFDVLVTYNGKAYDQPLLETRYRLARRKPPFARISHVDLLYGARRLWKLRLETCRLVDLENRILGVEREGDLPGALIPYVYFEYLRTREAFRLQPIFHHNAIDILTLACLAGIVPRVFQSPADAPLSHGADLVGIARWLRQAERHEDAAALFRRAVERGLKDDLLFRALWDLAALERKLGRRDAAVQVWSELSSGRNPMQAAALAELAKHCEHEQRDYLTALDHTRRALALGETPDLRRRQARLERKLTTPQVRTLL